MTDQDLNHLKKQNEIYNPIFFQRFQKLNFSNLKILDLGCGRGALSIDIAQRGAKKVVGIDINETRIEIANENLKTNHKDVIDKVSFIATDLQNHDEKNYDIIVSKDAFEHIMDLPDLMIEIKRKLKVGGKLITDFGPLFNSPFGDHRGIEYKLPWAHVFLPKKQYINKLNKLNSKKITTIYDLGLNGLSLSQFEKLLFQTKGLKVIAFQTNVTHNFLGKLSKVATYIPYLKEYFTYNITCTLERVS